MQVNIVIYLLLAFAAYRATRVIVDDTITEPLRERIRAWSHIRNTRTSEWITTLLTCPYCIGWWISGATLAAYHSAAGSWNNPIVHAIEWSAIAGAQALLNTLDFRLNDPGDD